MGEDIVVGIHAVKALLDAHPRRVTALLIDEGRVDARIHELVRLAEAARVAVRRVPRRKIELLAGGGRHQGVVARCQPLPVRGERDLRQFLDSLGAAPLILILDGVQDPHNLGACLRTADAAGADAVVVPIDHTSPITATVRKVASGAAERVALFQVKNLARAMELLQERGIWIFGAAGEAQTELYGTDLSGPCALALGAEGSGLRRLTREHCDLLLRIPMQGAVESLNVSVAAGVFVFEALRQRRAKAKTS
jgi:23S rRNA (guanosine2251-2'-O)-methyltransferase